MNVSHSVSSTLLLVEEVSIIVSGDIPVAETTDVAVTNVHWSTTTKTRKVPITITFRALLRLLPLLVAGVAPLYVRILNTSIVFEIRNSI